MKTKTKKNRFTVSYEVYNVRKRLEEQGIESAQYTPDWWYEYEMDLYLNGELIESWDSLSETYDGINRLTFESATQAAKNIVKDPKGYFNTPPYN